MEASHIEFNDLPTVVRLVNWRIDSGSACPLCPLLLFSQLDTVDII